MNNHLTGWRLLSGYPHAHEYKKGPLIETLNALDELVPLPPGTGEAGWAGITGCESNDRYVACWHWFDAIKASGLLTTAEFYELHHWWARTFM